ncbi:MAG: sugar transferase [Opitutales bacterium]|nr:sugar transferase [Opitutales bacterium]
MVKRLMDLLITLFTAPLWLPLLVVVAVLVRWKLGRPVFFRQLRPGYRAQPFRILKFRTMLDRNDAGGKPLPDAERLTDFGRRLRASSLDELPELLQVLSGKMSLVGPRPLMMEYIPLYSERQRRRHEARPGLTGWAQIHGRNSLDWAERLEMDVWYVENRSLWLDIKILARTIGLVLSRKGITAEGQATLQPFKGER